MTGGKQVILTQMPDAQRAVVVEIRGGRNVADSLDAIGIRPGKKITKISSMLMRGPITIEVDRVQVAIGFGMAQKIVVELDSNQ